MKKFEDRYIELLLKRCLNFDNTKSLFINYYKENKDFVDKLVQYAKNMGISDIYLDEEDPYNYHDVLKSISIDEMDNNDLFNDSIWDTYAKKNACFLMLKGEYPNLFSDIEPEKIEKASELKRNSKKIYREKQMTYECPWCIAVLPNKTWAKKIIPNSDNSYNDLINIIASVCLLDKYNPIDEWNNLLDNNAKKIDALNSLKIKELHYKNKIGTDLKVELPENAIWCGAGVDGTNLIVNMPSYEVFTSPDYSKTEGIVYSSKPLIYNGKVIDNFWLRFKDGKVCEFDAKKGKDVLKGIINGGKNNDRLGEVALVDYSSPISNSNIVFETTLYDENAACHLALGEAFSECIDGGLKMSKKELENTTLNNADNHVDFMIGTPDLEIKAITYNNQEVLIFQNGNYVYNNK